MPHVDETESKNPTSKRLSGLKNTIIHAVKNNVKKPKLCLPKIPAENAILLIIAALRIEGCSPDINA